MFLLDPTNEASFEIIGSNTSLVANFGSTTDNVYVRFFGNDPASNVGFLLGSSNVTPSHPIFILGEIHNDGASAAPDLTISRGNIGIGTTNATEKLMVMGNIVPGSCNIFDLGSSNYRWRDLYLSGNTIDLDGLRLSQNSNGDLILKDRNTSLKRVVVSEVQLGDALRIRDSGAGAVQFVSVNGNNETPINPIEYFGMTGNVGLGTTQANEKLHVVGNILVTGSVYATNLSASATSDTTNANNIVSGTLSVARLPTSGVTAGSYGTASSVPQVSVDPYGRVTSATNVGIVIASSKVTGLVSSATTDTTNAANITSGTISLARFAASGVSEGTFGSSTTVSQITVDPYGRVTNATGIAIIIPSTKVTGLVSSATVDTTNASNITSGTLAVARLPTTFVTAGSYGTASDVSQMTVDPYGRITSATNVPIVIQTSRVTGLVSSATIDTTNASNISSGTLPVARLPTTSVSAGSYGTASDVTQLTVDPYGRLTSAANVPIVIASTRVTGLVSSATVDTTNASNISSGTLPVARLPTTSVSAGSYGSASEVSQITVDPYGRLSAAANVPIVVASSSVTGLVSSATIDATNATNISTGTLPVGRLPTTTVTAGSYGTATDVSQFTVDPYGRITASANVPIVVQSSRVTGLVSSATIDTTNATNITSGTLSASRLPTSGVTAGTYGSSANVAQLVIDSYGRVTSASDTAISINYQAVSGLATVATTGNYNDLTNKTFVLNGSSAYYTGGDVGIGISQPTEKLHVAGNIYSSGTITASNLIIVDKFTTVDTVTSNTDQLYITNMGSGPALKVVQTGVNSIAEFYDDSQLALIVADGGYIGIGTATPAEKLAVYGNAVISGSISAANLSPSAFTDTTNANNITSGTLSLARVPTSGVTAGSYGSSSMVAQVTVDPYGRVTVASSVDIVISSSSVTGLVSSATIDATNATNITSGTISLARVPTSGVSAGSYGTVSDVPQVTIDPYGRVTTATNVPIVVASSRVTGLVSSATVDTTNAANISSGTLSLARVPTSGVTAGSYGTASQVSQLTVDPYGRVTTAANVPIVIASSSVTGLVSSATVDTTNATNITSGTLGAIRLPTSGVTAASYGSASAVPSFAVDQYGRITSVSNTSIAIASSAVSGLATVATTGNYNDLSNKTFVLNGTNAYFTSGNVAIGVSNPTARLTIGSGASDTSTAIHLNSGDLGVNTDKIILTYATDGSRIGHAGAWTVNHYAGRGADTIGSFRFYTGSGVANVYNERVTFAYNGNVGLGSAIPAYTLDVRSGSGDINFNGNLYNNTQSVISSGVLNATYLPTTGVTAGSYGSASSVPSFTVDSKGRISSVSNTTIVISTDKVTGLVSSATVDTTNAANITSGTLSLARVATSGVSAGSYGTATNVSQFTVDPYGRVTTATNIPILIASSSVTGLVTSATVDTTNAVNITSGTISLARVPTSGVTAGSYGSASDVAQLTVDPYGRVTVASNTPIIIASSRVTGLVSSATVDTTNATNISSGTLSLARIPTSGVTAGTYGSSTEVATFTVDPYGRVTSASQTLVYTAASRVSGLATVATTGNYSDLTNAPFTTANNYVSTLSSVGIGTSVPSTALHVTGTIRNDALSHSTVVTVNASSELVSSAVTTTELGYMSGVTSSVQTQLNDKLSLTSGGTVNANVSINGTLSTSNLNVLGSTTVVNSYTTENSNVVIRNLNGTGAALSITQQTILGNGTILECFDQDISTTTPVFIVADSGRVGVNTAAPTHTMHVEGDLKYTGSLVGSLNASSIHSGTLDSARLPLSGVTAGGYGSPSNIPILQVDDKGRITSIATAQVDIITNYHNLVNIPFLANGTNIYTTSNVGIGTSSPTRALSVQGSANISGSLHVENGITLGSNATMLTSYFQLNPVACNVIVTAASQSVFNVKASGIVTALGSNVDVFRNGIKLYATSNFYEYNVSSSFDYGASNTNFQISLARAANYGDMIDITVWPQLTQPSSQDPGRVFQYVNVADGIWTNSGTSQISYQGNVGIGVTSPIYQLQLSLDSAAKPTTNTWTATSDARVKENIEEADLERCYDVVKELPLKRFRWSSNVMPTVPDRHMLGWIAQEVEPLIPNAVTYSSNYGFSDMRGLDSDQIIKFMYGALQKSMSKIEALEKELITLKSIIKP